MWGLSNGIFMLSFAGIVWLMLAAWSADWAWTGTHSPLDSPWLHGPFLPWGASLTVAIALMVFAGGLRVRRKSMGFSLAEIRNSEEGRRQRLRKIRIAFASLGVVQGLLCWLCVWLGIHFDRLDLIWPGIGLVVSLHFLPLARLFRVRPYYLTAAAGVAVSLFAILVPQAALLPSLRLVILGAGMGGSLWITAAYLIHNADATVRVWDHAN
jgi:hypothetical protein